MSRRPEIKSAVTFLVCALLALITVAPPAMALKINDDLVKITFLQLNDVYQIDPVDHGLHGGLARVATLKREIMAKTPDAIFVLAGDTLSPSVASKVFKGQQMIAGWNALNLDYSTFGNHEFDFGPFELLQRMKDSKFTWVCSNVLDKSTKQPFGGAKPFVIRDIDGVKVGIFGMLTTDTEKRSRPGPNVVIENPNAVVEKTVAEMKKGGAQVIVGLTHLTIEQDKEIARIAPINVILGGHEHIVIQAFTGQTPILKMGSDARNLGKIEISFSKKKNQVESIDWEIIPVTQELRDDPEVTRALADYETKLHKELDLPAGTTAVDLDALQNHNTQEETNLGDMIADAFREATESDVAIFNGGAVRSNQIYPAGTITHRDVMSVLPFENPVVKLKVHGTTIRQALEHGVSRVSLESNKGDGRFPQVSGLRFRYDAARPLGNRVVEVSVNGKPLDDKATYTLATTAFVLAGGDGYSMFKDQPFLVKPEEGRAETVILLDALEKSKPIAPKVDGRIQRISN